MKTSILMTNKYRTGSRSAILPRGVVPPCVEVGWTCQQLRGQAWWRWRTINGFSFGRSIDMVGFMMSFPWFPMVSMMESWWFLILFQGFLLSFALASNHISKCNYKCFQVTKWVWITHICWISNMRVNEKWPKEHDLNPAYPHTNLMTQFRQSMGVNKLRRPAVHFLKEVLQ